MQKLDGKSKDIVADNIDKLKEMFPEIFREDKIDFEILQQILGENIEDKVERYGFEWNGKSKAIKLAQTPSTGTLRPCKEESKNWDTTENLYIEGDNLEALKLLQKTYHNRVKMIYIDPPYNTGQDFVYPDNYQDNLKNYLEITGQVDKEGRRISTNSEASGRYHTQWLNMMYPRLRLARNLLSDDGVIFISIDDNEVHNLRKICDEVFGESNFIAQLIRRTRSGSNDAINNVSIDHEYLLSYGKTVDVQFNGVIKDTSRYKNPDNDPRGPWARDNLTCGKTASERPNLFYSITDPKTGVIYECNSTHVWRFEKPKMLQLINENKIIFPKDKDGIPNYKRHLSELRSHKKPFSSLINSVINTVATKETRDIFNAQIFNYPKSIDLIKQLIDQCTDNESIILDFFSGSASLAHATMQLNIEDGGNRKFIMVQLPEPTDENSEAYKVGYKNICEIGKERIRRAGNKILEENRDKEGIDNLDVGFKVFKLDSSNLKRWNPNFDELEDYFDHMTDNFVEGRTEEDVLYEIMLKFGIDLTYQVEITKINGKKIYSIGQGSLFICLDNDITLDVIKGIVRLKNDINSEITRVVFKDNGFKDDSVKTNALQILEKNNIEEVMSI